MGAYYGAVPKRGWRGRRRALAKVALRRIAAIAIYTLILVEIYVYGVILLPPPPGAGR